MLIAPEPDRALPSGTPHTCIYMRVTPRKYQCCVHRLGTPAFSALALACVVYKTVVWAHRLLAYSYGRWGWGGLLPSTSQANKFTRDHLHERITR